MTNLTFSALENSKTKGPLQSVSLAKQQNRTNTTTNVLKTQEDKEAAQISNQSVIDGVPAASKSKKRRAGEIVTSPTNSLPEAPTQLPSQPAKKSKKQPTREASTLSMNGSQETEVQLPSKTAKGPKNQPGSQLLYL